MTTINIDHIRGDTFIKAFPQSNIGIPANVWFTLKDKNCQDDSESIIQVDLISGLLYVNGQAATDPALAFIFVAGYAITVFVHESITKQIPSRYPLIYDVQVLQEEDIRTIFRGRWANVSDVTRDTQSANQANVVLWSEGNTVLWSDGTAVLWPFEG